MALEGPEAVCLADDPEKPPDSATTNTGTDYTQQGAVPAAETTEEDGQTVAQEAPKKALVTGQTTEPREQKVALPVNPNEESDDEDTVSSLESLMMSRQHNALTAAEAQTEWLYRDAQGVIQGPYRADVIVSWIHAGYFTPLTHVKLPDEEAFLPVSEHPTCPLWNGQLRLLLESNQQRLMATAVHSSVDDEAVADAEHVSDEAIVRIGVTKINVFERNHKVTMELDCNTCHLHLLGIEAEPLTPDSLLSVHLLPERRLKLVYTFKKHRLLRDARSVTVAFRSVFERERMTRLIHAKMAITKQQNVSQEYQPQPLQVSAQHLEMLAHLPVEDLAEELHVSWSKAKVADGWVYATVEDLEAKTHPNLVNFHQLSKQEQAYDRNTSEMLLGTIVGLGYSVVLESAHGYRPSPKLSDHPQLLSLVDFLAENAHESWAQQKITNGWKYGPVKNLEAKAHPLLVPFLDMSEDDKDLDRSSARKTLNALLQWGYNIFHGEAGEEGITVASNPDFIAQLGVSENAKVVDILKVEVFEDSESVFDSVLHNSEALAAFTDFLETEHSEENITFINEIHDILELSDLSAKLRRLQELIDQYVGAESVATVNISSQLTEDLLALGSMGLVGSETLVDKFAKYEVLLERAKAEIYGLLARDSLPRFLQSVQYEQFMTALRERRVVRFQVTKINKYNRNGPRQLSFDTQSNTILVHKPSAPDGKRKAGNGRPSVVDGAIALKLKYSITPETLIRLDMNNSDTRLTISFFPFDSVALELKKAKELRFIFSTQIERRRFARLVAIHMEALNQHLPYTPKPWAVPPETEARLEKLPIRGLAVELHRSWVEHKHEQGYVYGTQVDDTRKEHPNLVPFEDLTQEEQDYDVNSARFLASTILGLGYSIEKSDSGMQKLRDDAELLLLVDFLAENAHEAWAARKMALGWSYGLERNNALLTHPDLVRYTQLPETSKQADKQQALKVINSLLSWCFIIKHNGPSVEMEDWQSLKNMTKAKANSQMWKRNSPSSKKHSLLWRKGSRSSRISLQLLPPS